MTQQQDFITFLKESNLTATQIAGGEDIPKDDVVVKWTFEIGKTLVPPEVVFVLPTTSWAGKQGAERPGGSTPGRRFREGVDERGKFPAPFLNGSYARCFAMFVLL